METSIDSPPPAEPPRTAEISPPAPSQTAEDPPKDSASSPPAPSQTQDDSPKDSASSPPTPLDTMGDAPEDKPLHPPAEPPLLVNSISELKSFALAATAFQKCYDDLIRHLHSIRYSIAVILPSDGSEIPDSSPSQQNPKSDRNSEFTSLNKALCGKNMRRYIMTHLNDVQKLREEVPHALKLATNPSKLVLDSLGKFYLQGKKAFEKDSPMMASREASIFMLECFLLMMGSYENDAPMEVDRSALDEAEAIAVTWKKRLVAEGGLATASEVDARGLLLFIACFGVPVTFRRRDVRDLAEVGNGKEVSGLLRKSRKFLAKMIEIVEELLKVKMDVDAVDMIYTFGLEEKFSPRTILLTYLNDSKASWKSPKQSGPLDGKKKKLAALKSIRKCLEKHKIDPAKMLPGWQVAENIEKLERAIAESARKAANKKPPPLKRKPGPEPSPSPSLKKPKPRNPTWPGFLSHHHAPPHPPPQQHQQPTQHNSHVVTYSAPPVLYGEAGPSAAAPPLQQPSAYPTHSYYGGVITPADVADQSAVNHGNYAYQWHAAAGDGGLIEKYLGQPSSSSAAALYHQAPQVPVEGLGGAANNAAAAAVAPQASAAAAAVSEYYQYVSVAAGAAGIEQQQQPHNGAGSSSVIAQHPYLYHHQV